MILLDCLSPAPYALTLAAALAAPAALAGTTPMPQHHVFVQVATSPDGRHVASVEGDASAWGGAPIVRSLVLRAADGKTTTLVSLPCGAVAQCWPASPAWTPDSRKVTFALRTPGSHARSLYEVNADGSDLQELLKFSGTIQQLRYSADGQLAVLATENATKELGAVEAGAPILGDLGGLPPEQRIALFDHGALHWVSPPDLFVYQYDWRPDGRGFVATAARGDGDNNWWIAKLYGFDSTGAEPHILYTPANSQQQLAFPKVSPDGKRVAFIVGIMSDFHSTGGDIYVVPIAGGAANNVTAGLQSSVNDIRWECSGHLTATTFAGALTRVIDLGADLKSPGKTVWEGQEQLGYDDTEMGDGGCPAGIVAITHQSFNRPVEIEIGPLGKWHDLTHANSRLSAPFKVQSLSWKSDEYDIDGWLILPEHAGDTGKMPLITSVHGGPSSAYRPRFLAAGQVRMLLEHDYAVLLPNPRGSYGHGEAFTKANVRDFGYGDLRDILAGVDAAVRAAPIDAERVGITGHSYGGFMTMWAVTQTQRFKAAVAGAGIADWLSYYGENGIDEWMIPFFGSSVYDDPAVYARSSPITFIRQVRTPTLSYVGAADIECPAAQTQEFGHALRALNVPEETIIYPNEGHAIRDPAHLADMDERTLAWFDRYLKASAVQTQQSLQ
jgi:dipeptidyl aminopeptidase/acylaminoacyl peptidase